MFGISYGELFLLLGATAALIGPKDLPVIARTAGRLAGRAIGYVQLARGQFENVMQQSQAHQVHKELQDTMAQLEAIRHEIRSISVLNPGPLTRRLVDNIDHTSESNSIPENLDLKNAPKVSLSEPSVEQRDGGSAPTAMTSKVSESCIMHSQATAYSRWASSALKTGSLQNDTDARKMIDETDLLNVLPVSAETAGMLPHRADDVKGSDIVLEAILEADVAHNAKQFFAQPQNKIK
ncbi:uncharacterized protein [Euphorbia lathyris]|uniref:uncharacterized protein isoform X2 n=1 Tax=Euphorbia lathyris TaxID=212925 RepID=UPI0033142971